MDKLKFYQVLEKSDMASYYNEWTIRITNNDSIEMSCSLKTDSLD